MSTILELYESANIQAIDEAAIEMEWNGFMIDPAFCAAGLEVALNDERQQLTALAEGVARLGVPPLPGIDDVWSSGPQLSTLLEQHLKLPPSPYKVKGKVDLDAGKRSTDKRALEWIGTRPGIHPEARRIVEGVVSLRRIRNSAKYLAKFPRFIGPDGFIHPVCGPAGDEDDRVGAVTGRFGMKNPEGQQVPKDPRKDKYFIRRAFIAPRGQSLIVADYTALEVVILANICEWMFGDTQLLDMTSPGQDIHALNAHGIFGKQLNWVTPSGRRIADFPEAALYKSDPELAWYRDAVKAVWYKLQYGGTVHGFATSLLDRDGEPVGEAVASDIVSALYAQVPGIQKLHAFIRGELQKSGRICSLDGREADYTDLIARGRWGLDAACRKADNHPMQATGAAIIGNAMVAAVRCPELRKLGAKLQLQIHDELQFRADDAVCERVAPLVVEHMQAAYPLKNLFATVGIGKNLLDAKH